MARKLQGLVMQWVYGLARPLAGRFRQLGRPPKRPRSLIKSRPVRFAQDYVVVQDDALADETFIRLRQHIFRAVEIRNGGALEGGGASPARLAILREFGRIGADRLYFYLKPMNQVGWLFERSGAGWVVSRAEKIAQESMFLRRGAAWDIVALYQAQGREGLPRIMAPKIASQLLSFPLYEHKLFQALQIDEAKAG